jgi:putative ATP-binding cassette transporter
MAPTAALNQNGRVSAVVCRQSYGSRHPDPARINSLKERLVMQDKVTVTEGACSTVNLSTGQRKRLAFFIAELEDKPVIILDEWATDQDPHFHRVFYEQFLPDLKACGKIVISATHDDRWFHLADRLYQMDEAGLEHAKSEGIQNR